MDFWDVVNSRRSVRSFESTPVPRELVERMVAAASEAPSTLNTQPWRFHIAQGDARAELGEIVARATVHLKEYMDVLPVDHYQESVRWYSSLGDAPIVIAVSMPEPDSELDQINKLLSIGAAVENLMLAATAEGLATCNVTFAWWVKDALADALELEDGRAVVSLIALGYERGEPGLRPARNADVATWLD